MPNDEPDRPAEKRASREADAKAIASGEKTREQLARENGLPLDHNAPIDFAKVRAPK